MNKENIQKVIDAIAFNEHSHFNMSTYIGSLNDHNHDDVYLEQVTSLNITDEDLGKDIFDCNTTCCIAGFASALSYNWVVDKELVNSNGIHYEERSNEYLGLTKAEGKNLYYAEHDSVWKMLKYNHPDFSYLSIDTSNSEWSGNYENEDDLSYYDDDSDANIDLNSITPEMAIKALEMIISGELILANEYGQAELKIVIKG